MHKVGVVSVLQMLQVLKLNKMPNTIKEVIKNKFWIVESAYGKVGTIRSTEKGFEFYNPKLKILLQY